MQYWRCAWVARCELLKCPQAEAAFTRLAGRITADDMRAMNYAVDGEEKMLPRWQGSSWLANISSRKPDVLSGSANCSRKSRQVK